MRSPILLLFAFVTMFATHVLAWPYSRYWDMNRLKGMFRKSDPSNEPLVPTTNGEIDEEGQNTMEKIAEGLTPDAADATPVTEDTADTASSSNDDDEDAAAAADDAASANDDDDGEASAGAAATAAAVADDDTDSSANDDDDEATDAAATTPGKFIAFPDPTASTTETTNNTQVIDPKPSERELEENPITAAFCEELLQKVAAREPPYADANGKIIFSNHDVLMQCKHKVCNFEKRFERAIQCPTKKQNDSNDTEKKCQQKTPDCSTEEAADLEIKVHLNQAQELEDAVKNGCGDCKGKSPEATKPTKPTKPTAEDEEPASKVEQPCKCPKLCDCPKTTETKMYNLHKEVTEPAEDEKPASEVQKTPALEPRFAEPKAEQPCKCPKLCDCPKPTKTTIDLTPSESTSEATKLEPNVEQTPSEEPSKFLR